MNNTIASQNGRLSPIIFWYMVKQVALAILICFLFFTVVFVLNTIYLYAKDLFEQNVSGDKIFWFIFTNIPYSVLLAAPFGTLMGTLISISLMSQNNEIQALHALGFSKRAIFTPVLLLGVTITFASFTVNDLLLPMGAIEFKKILQEITIQNPAVELDSFSVKDIKQGKQLTMVTGEVTEELVNDPIIFDKDSEGRRRIIIANEAYFGKEQEEGVALELIMEDVKVLVPHDKIRGNYEYYAADLMSYNILLQEFNTGLGSPSPLEMTSRDLFGEIQELRASLAEDTRQFEDRIQKHRLELYGNYLEALDLLQGGTKRQENLERYLSPTKEKITIEASRSPQNARIGYFELEFYQKFSLPLGVLTFVIFVSL
jgi:lipopolysaccharide export system permease protein